MAFASIIIAVDKYVLVTCGSIFAAVLSVGIIELLWNAPILDFSQLFPLLKEFV